MKPVRTLDSYVRGMVGVGSHELRIFHDRYELWDFTGSPTLLDTSYATTSGWHNIGLRAGIDAGVWVDGSQIMSYGVGLYVNEKVKFGTLQNTIAYMNGEEPATVVADGIQLYENLNYLRSYNRSQADMSEPPGAETGGYPVGGMRVTHTEYDGPTMLDAKEVDDDGMGNASVYLAWESEEDGTRIRHEHAGGEYTDLHLPNPRRHGALIIRDAADQWVNDEGTLTLDETAHPGVIANVLVDAVGQPTACVQADPAVLSFCWGPDTDSTNIFTAPVYSLDGATVRLGIGVQLLADQTTNATSTPIAGVVTGDNAEADQAADGADQCDNGECCFRQHAPNESYDVVQTDTPTAGSHNGNRGGVCDYQLNVGYGGPTVAEAIQQVPYSEEFAPESTSLKLGQWEDVTGKRTDADEDAFEAAFTKAFSNFGIDVFADGGEVYKVGLTKGGHKQLYDMLVHLMKSKHTITVYDNRWSNLRGSSCKGHENGKISVKWEMSWGLEVDADWDANYDTRKNGLDEAGKLAKLGKTAAGEIDSDVVPPALILIHELIHALNITKGQNVENVTAGVDVAVWSNQEEERTITGISRDKAGKIIGEADISEYGLIRWANKKWGTKIPLRKGHRDGSADGEPIARPACDENTNEATYNGRNIRTSSQSTKRMRAVKVDDVWQSKVGATKPKVVED